jgi:superoxide dismutase, Fe-Mn family
MNKRDFIKNSLISIAAFSSVSLKANNILKATSIEGFSIPALPYSVNDINEIFSKASFNKHYTQHYIEPSTRLNQELKQVIFKPRSVRELLSNTNQFSNTLIDNACAYYNHKMFFKLLNPTDNKVSNTGLLASIENSFGSKDKFTQLIVEQANKLDQQGWIWLVLQNNELKLITTKANDNPLLSNISSHLTGFPILGIDLWEHAYKPDYGLNKHEYVDAILDHINWEYAEKRFIRAQNYSSI